MYYWKYWRDTRRGVFVYLGLLAVFAVIWLAGMYRANRIHNIADDPATLWAMVLGITVALCYLCALVMGFVTGSNSVGADIGNGTGDFLLTRPRSKRYFIWAGWLAGITELFALIGLTGLIVFSAAFLASRPDLRHVSFAPESQVNDAASVFLNGVATIALTAAIIFGLTYFLTVLFRSGQRGVIASLAILFGYSIGSSLLENWAGITLPRLNFLHGNSDANFHWYQAARFQIPCWTLFSLAFPVAAQINIERRDI